MGCKVRPYSGNDRETVRHICCETGFMGDPIEPLFTDRDAFADFFTRYYTDIEKESCLVAEDQGRVVGYLTGCVRHRFYPFAQALLVGGITIPKVILRAAAGKYEKQNYRFLKWVLTRSASETPAYPKRSAHFHVNFLPEWRNGKVTRRIIFRFIKSLPGRGVKRVYGQIQTYGDARPAKVFERYGFRLFDQRRISRFEKLSSREVYVSTFVREFDV